MPPALVARARYRIGTSRPLLALDSLKARLVLRRAAARAYTVDAIVDAAFTVRAGNPPIAPVQVRSEICNFIDLVRQEAPRRVLEIGTSHGGTLYLLAWAAAPNARLLSIDIRDLTSRLDLYRSFAGPRQRVEVMLRDSHETATRDAVVEFFDGEAIDVLFIDGDHSYEGARHDFELYGPLVRPGGLIACHDIVDGPEVAVGGVPRFWRDLKRRFGETSEFVESWSQGGFGIGVLRCKLGTRISLDI